MVLHADENIDYKLVWNVVETLIEVANTALRVFLENFELWILLIKLVGDGAADDVSKHRFKSLLITVVILDGQHKARIVVALLLTLDISFLSHHSNRLVCSLDLDRLDISDGYAVNHSCLSLFSLLPLKGLFFRPYCFCGKVSSPACVGKALIYSLRLAHSLMTAYDVLSCNLLSGFIWNPLQLLVLHLSSDSLTGIFRHGVVLVFQQLLLYRLHFIIDSVTVEKGRVRNSN